MEMNGNNRNKRTIIIVFCLLLIVVVVGSYAYFMTNSNVNGDPTVDVNTKTANIGDALLTTEGTLSFNDLDILPGHKNISVLKLTAKGNNELVPYNLIWTGSNGLGIPLKFSVYKTSSKVDASVNCEKKIESVVGGKAYFETCTINNESSLGGVVASGEIAQGESKTILVEDEFVTATSDGQVVYYYVVLEYPNLESDQSEDMGGKFQGDVTVEEGKNKPDVNIMAVYTKGDGDADYTRVDNVPSKSDNLGFNKSKSTCTNGATPDWDNSEWYLAVKNLTKSGTSCYLYFDKESNFTAGNIIAEITGIATDDSMFAGITGDGVYTWTKGDYSGGSQTIKYYRGNVSNNWVVFGKDGDQYIWWRIIRNNSNGSIRMIYAGTSASKTSAPATTGEGTQIGTKAFNTSYNNNMYVGFKYTNNQVHGNGTNSTILGAENSTDKTTLYGWYNATLAKSADYSGKIDLDAGFCNDRGPSTSSSSLNGSGGTGTTTTYYAAYIRLITNKAPSLLCASTSDIFKTPVGLITADEVSMGGMVYSSPVNTSSYLYTNSSYWTMSPSNVSGAYVFIVWSSGYLDNYGVNSTYGVRPVVNLKSDTLFVAGGAGTNTNPYVVYDRTN